MADIEDTKNESAEAGEEKKAVAKKKVVKKATKKKVVKKTAKKKVTKKVTKKKVEAKPAEPAEVAESTVRIPEDPPLVDPDTVAPIVAAEPEPEPEEKAGGGSAYDQELVEKLQAIGVMPDESAAKSQAPAASSAADSRIKGADFLFRVLYGILIIGAVLLYMFAVYLPDAEQGMTGEAVEPQEQAEAAQIAEQAQPVEEAAPQSAETEQFKPQEQPAAAEQAPAPGAEEASPESDAGLRSMPAEQLELLNKTFGD